MNLRSQQVQYEQVLHKLWEAQDRFERCLLAGDIEGAVKGREDMRTWQKVRAGLEEK